MQARLNFFSLAPDAVKALTGLEAFVRGSGLDKPLVELVKLRASQINGCAYCLDMHTQDARAAGETEQRLYCVSAWRECPFYTDAERVALEWTEAVTRVADAHVSDDLFERAKSTFGEAGLVALNFAVVAINAWNRLAVPFHSVPGQYKPAAKRS